MVLKSCKRQQSNSVPKIAYQSNVSPKLGMFRKLEQRPKSVLAQSMSTRDQDPEVV